MDSDQETGKKYRLEIKTSEILSFSGNKEVIAGEAVNPNRIVSNCI